MQFLLDKRCETRKNARAPIPQFRSIVITTAVSQDTQSLAQVRLHVKSAGIFIFELSRFFVEKHISTLIIGLTLTITLNKCVGYLHIVTNLLHVRYWIVTNSNLTVQFVQTLMSSRALKLSSQSLGRDSSMSSTDRPLRRSLRAMQLRWTRQGYKLTKKKRKRDAPDKLIHDFTWKKETKCTAEMHLR